MHEIEIAKTHNNFNVWKKSTDGMAKIKLNILVIAYFKCKITTFNMENP